MKYPLETKSTLTGVTLLARVPVTQVDNNALHTIRNDPPPFLIPFTYRQMDETVEFCYQLGALTKARYFGGQRNAPEYADFWLNVLGPVLQCEDWFMKPFSFVFDIEHLYYATDAGQGASIRYVYLPVYDEVSDSMSLRALIEALTQHVFCTDKELEAIVLRSVLKFNPVEFIKNLREYKPAASIHSPVVPRLEKPLGNTPAPLQPPQPPRPPLEAAKQAQAPQAPQPSRSPLPPQPSPSIGGDDIVIAAAPAGKKSLRRSKAEKTPPPPKVKKSFFSSKQPKQQDVVLGAASIKDSAPPDPPSPEISYTPPVMEFGDDVTVLSERPKASQGARFRLEGDRSLPPHIQLPADMTRPFSIGRFDIKLGQKQNDFEFEAETKNITRRHAVIERTENGYVIIDLNSRAGTFVDGKRILPGVPSPLSAQCRVSFGGAGADYVFEPLT